MTEADRGRLQREMETLLEMMDETDREMERLRRALERLRERAEETRRAAAKGYQ